MNLKPTLRPLGPRMGRADRRALHLLGAIAAFLLVGGLIVRGSLGLAGFEGDRIVDVDPETGEVLGGSVQLVPGSDARLFAGVELLPGQEEHACLEIGHRGDVRLEGVLFELANVDGPEPLLRALHLEVAQGQASGGGCEGFVVEDAVSGPLHRLARSGPGDGWADWVPQDGDSAVFRLSLSLPNAADDALQGTSASSDFRWTATAAPSGGNLAEKALMLLAAVAREALLPLLLLVVCGVIFLGIQDRIDRRDPKLALAAIVEEPEPFLSVDELLAHASLVRQARPAAVAGRPR